MPPRSRADEGQYDETLHASQVEQLERRIMELALERTGARSGALFLWNAEADGLALDFHVVEGLFVNLPDRVLRHRRDGRPEGIAFQVFDRNEPYLCADTAADPHYARYFLDVGSIAAVPIPYQRRAIGVLSVSARERAAFTQAHLDELQALAASSAKFLRRAQLHRQQQGDTGRVLLIKGLSPEWLAVERQIEQVSATDAPVLLHGESGTGKELVANAIRFNSPRAKRPFVVVNCAAIPDTLLESMLFGHVRGAFTGATASRTGELTRAHGGTLFLDEVAELPLPLQPKLLRAVEYGEVQPVGSDAAPARVDVRLICASNRDLPAMVRRGAFREDLYYRISLVTVELPPLRSFRGQIPVLAQVMLERAARRHKRGVHLISAETMALLEAYDYPGNVRELRNVLEYAVLMAPGEEIRPADLPASLRTPIPAPAPAADRPPLRALRRQWLAPRERRYLAELLDECRGNVRTAARAAGVNTVTLYRLLRRHGLQIDRRVKA